MTKKKGNRIEVELKAHISDIKSLRKKVSEIARFRKRIKQEDIYFTFANKSGYQKQRFRLRLADGSSVVTVKIEGESGYGIEANQEFEFEVSDPEAFKIFCREFGFRVLVEKTKIVERYELKKAYLKGFAHPVIIEINRIDGLGYFIEIESIVETDKDIPVASEFIRSVLKLLGISESQIEPVAYTELIYRKIYPA